MAEYQRRYVWYCRAKGLVPGAGFDGGDYIRWINARWRDWDIQTGHKGPHMEADHVAFDLWLNSEPQDTTPPRPARQLERERNILQ